MCYDCFVLKWAQTDLLRRWLIIFITLIIMVIMSLWASDLNRGELKVFRKCASFRRENLIGLYFKNL